MENVGIDIRVVTVYEEIVCTLRMDIMAYQLEATETSNWMDTEAKEDCCEAKPRLPALTC